MKQASILKQLIEISSQNRKEQEAGLIRMQITRMDRKKINQLIYSIEMLNSDDPQEAELKKTLNDIIPYQLKRLDREERLMEIRKRISTPQSISQQGTIWKHVSDFFHTSKGKQVEKKQKYQIGNSDEQFPSDEEQLPLLKNTPEKSPTHSESKYKKVHLHQD